MKLVTILLLATACGACAQEITAYDLGLSNADVLKPRIVNRLTIERHREEDRIKQEEKRVKQQKEREYQDYLFQGQLRAEAEIIATQKERQKEQVQENILNELENQTRELQEQNNILREVQYRNRNNCERPRYLSDYEEIIFNNRRQW